jgi:hypothetical protein
MFDAVKSLLKSGAANLAGFGARPVLNGYLKGIGEIKSLSIDPAAGTVDMELMLNGEAAPILLKAGYILKEEDGRLSASLTSLAASRPWIAEVFERYLKGRGFPLPDKAAPIVRMILG